MHLMHLEKFGTMLYLHISSLWHYSGVARLSLQPYIMQYWLQNH